MLVLFQVQTWMATVSTRRQEHGCIISFTQSGVVVGKPCQPSDSDCCLFSPSLELRVPFLDHRFSSYYLSLPPEMRIPKVGKSTLGKNPKIIGSSGHFTDPPFVPVSGWHRKTSPERDFWGLQPATQRDSLATQGSLQWWDHLSQELLVQDFTGLRWTSGLSLKICSGTIIVS